MPAGDFFRAVVGQESIQKSGVHIPTTSDWSGDVHNWGYMTHSHFATPKITPSSMIFGPLAMID